MYNLTMEKKNKKIAVEPIDTDVNRFLLTNGI